MLSCLLPILNRRFTNSFRYFIMIWTSVPTTIGAKYRERNLTTKTMASKTLWIPVKNDIAVQSFLTVLEFSKYLRVRIVLATTVTLCSLLVLRHNNGTEFGIGIQMNICARNVHGISFYIYRRTDCALCVVGGWWWWWWWCTWGPTISPIVRYFHILASGSGAVFHS